LFITHVQLAEFISIVQLYSTFAGGLLIDTGFTGFLSLPLSMIESLKLPWIFSDSVTLGDGSEVIFQMYRAIVIWDGQFKVVDVAASESEPLLGMSLLYSFKLQVEAVERGTVTIEAMT
jgi:clan AA aspartic protease